MVAKIVQYFNRIEFRPKRTLKDRGYSWVTRVAVQLLLLGGAENQLDRIDNQILQGQDNDVLAFIVSHNTKLPDDGCCSQLVPESNYE